MPKMRPMRLSLKMPLFVTGICLVMATGLASLTYFPYRAKTYSDAKAYLLSMAEQRVEHMTALVDDIGDETRLLAFNPETVTAMSAFQSAWTKIEGSPEAYVQATYVTNNPNPSGERDKLDRADDVTDYTIAHGRHHPYLREFQRVGEFYDVFLINLNGDVV